MNKEQKRLINVYLDTLAEVLEGNQHIDYKIGYAKGTVKSLKEIINEVYNLKISYKKES